MHPRFRSALVWLLLLALPIQGFAMAAMTHCGPRHHQMMMAASSAAAVEAAPHATSAHHHGHHAANEHEHAHADAIDAGSHAAHDLDKLSKFKCSACAACCMGMAMPSAALFIPSLPPAGRLVAPSYAAPAEFLSGGLDRPPRISLA